MVRPGGVKNFAVPVPPDLGRTKARTNRPSIGDAVHNAFAPYSLPPSSSPSGENPMLGDEQLGLVELE